MSVQTLLREAEHEALENITLNGTILDIGGDSHADYRNLLRGKHTFSTINLDQKTGPDLLHDLEKPLPIGEATFDNALLMNVLEHIYNYRQLLSETVRILKPGGAVVIVVPFLFPVHPSPYDFRRFTAVALEREMSEAGFSNVQVSVLGGGVWTAVYVLVDRLMPHLFRLFGRYTLGYIALAGDRIFSKLAQLLGKKYNASDYALGYVASAQKPGA